MESIEKVFSALGVENAGELIQKPESINSDELANAIRTNLRAQLTGDVEFTGSYVEQGKQSVLGELYDLASQHFGLPKEQILNKPMADVLALGKAESQKGLSKTNKDYEDTITQLNKKLHEFENIIMPRRDQMHEEDKAKIRNEYMIKEAISAYKLSEGISREVAESFILREIFDPTKFKLTRDASGAMLITTHDGRAVRREDRKDLPALDIKGTIGYLLEKGGLLEKQGKPKQTPSGITTPTVDPVTTGLQNVVISQQALENQRALAQKYGK